MWVKTEQKEEVAAKQHNPAIWPIRFVYMSIYGSNAMYLPFAPIFMKTAGLTEVQIGLIGTVRPFVSFISMPFWGAIADRWSMWAKVLLLGLMFSATCIKLSLLMCTSFPLIALVLVGGDFLGNPVLSIIDSTALDAIPDPLAFGRLRLFGTIGWGTMAPLGGLLLEARGMGVTFITSGALALAVMLLITQLRVTPPKRNAPPAKGGWRVMFEDPLTILLLLGTLLMGQCYGAIGSFLFVRLQALGAGSVLMGLTLSMNCLVEAPCFFFAERAIRALGLVGVMQVCLVLMAARLFFYSLLVNPWMVLLVEGIHGVTYSLWFTAGSAHCRRLATNGNAASLQGFFNGIKVGVGAGTGSLIATAVSSHSSIEAMFSVFALAVLAMAALLTLAQASGRLGPRTRLDEHKGDTESHLL
mmetsp:Transcript_72060/g.108764  ORF Transcript_72060/g.108764 Transcript_72060/m.108764 type:complete len:414 (+) Transcript_72060:159-1400(+)